MFGSTGSTFGGFGQQNQQNQQQQQQQGGGLFGGAATNTGGFGSTFGQSSAPAFGAAAQPAQNTGFGGFGAAASAAPAFGQAASAAPAFGQPAQQAGGGLFGSSQPAATNGTGFSFGGGGTSTFGQSNNNTTGNTGGLFGAKPATTGFGGFGQPAQPAATGGGLFGGGAAAAPAFGAAAPAGQGTGTAVAPYQATTVMEPPAEEGKPPPANQTPHQFQSIVCMPQYSKYSFEELRLQDYQANRKTPSATPGFGTAFGASSTPAFGAANTGNTGGGLFGNTSSTPAFGAANPSTPAFGASNNTGGGLFGGGATGTGAFGQPATSQPAAGGGHFGAASQPAQTGGLFGSSAPAASPFGQPATSAAPSFGGFGAAAQPKPASTGFSFGATPTSQPAAGGGLFGSTQPAQPAASNPFGQPAQPAAGGGLFGSTQPAAGAAPSFSFGQPAAAKPSLFGATPASSAPAFGTAPAATAPKPAFSFGSAPAAGGTGGGLFGQPQQQPAAGGGLFGGGTSTFGQPAQPAAGTNTFGSGGLFGAKPAAPAGGGLFGSTQPATGGGLFGSTAAQPAQSSSLFGSSAPAPALGGSLFGSQAAQQPQQQQPTSYASADDANAYGSNPLFASAAGVSPVRPLEEKKKPPIFTAFRGTPVSRSSTKITRLRGFGSSTASPAPGTPLGLGSSLSASTFSASGSTPGTPGGRGSPLRLINGIGDDVALSANAFVSRPSVKKLVIDKKTAGKTFGAAASPDKEPASAGQRAKVTFNPEVEVPSRSASLFGSRTPGPSNGADETSFAASEGATDGNLTFDSPSLAKTASATEWPSRRAPASASSPAKPKHGDYFTIPSLDTLQKLPAAKLRAVPDLVVGRVGYGQVAFSEPVNLTTLSSIEDLLGNLVRLEDRNATVYPEEYEDVKPPPGSGLNVPATITLEGCWPLDKATRKPIKDKDHARVQQHLKRLRNLEGTDFIDFDAELGKWTFGVEEF
ncbi:hypothetical protein JCM11641_006148 [Rhodosporidiobolus odoratus]